VIKNSEIDLMQVAQTQEEKGINGQTRQYIYSTSFDKKRLQP